MTCQEEIICHVFNGRQPSLTRVGCSSTRTEYFWDSLVCIPRKSDAKLNQSEARRCRKDPPVWGLGGWVDEGCLNWACSPLPHPFNQPPWSGHTPNTVWSSLTQSSLHKHTLLQETETLYTKRVISLTTFCELLLNNNSTMYVLPLHTL